MGLINGTIRLGDGQLIYLLGTVSGRDFVPHIRQVDYMDDYASTQYLQHVGTCSLIRSLHWDLVQWLAQQEARTTAWVDPQVFSSRSTVRDWFSYGLGFHPQQKHLETLFVLKWS